MHYSVKSTHSLSLSHSLARANGISSWGQVFREKEKLDGKVRDKGTGAEIGSTVR